MNAVSCVNQAEVETHDWGASALHLSTEPCPPVYTTNTRCSAKLSEEGIHPIVTRHGEVCLIHNINLTWVTFQPSRKTVQSLFPRSGNFTSCAREREREAVALVSVLPQRLFRNI